MHDTSFLSTSSKIGQWIQSICWHWSGLCITCTRFEYRVRRKTHEHRLTAQEKFSILKLNFVFVMRIEWIVYVCSNFFFAAVSPMIQWCMWSWIWFDAGKQAHRVVDTNAKTAAITSLFGVWLAHTAIYVLLVIVLGPHLFLCQSNNQIVNKIDVSAHVCGCRVYTLSVHTIHAVSRLANLYEIVAIQIGLDGAAIGGDAAQIENNAKKMSYYWSTIWKRTISRKLHNQPKINNIIEAESIEQSNALKLHTFILCSYEWSRRLLHSNQMWIPYF